MEQVFSAVSSLLKLHRATQQRNLGIRTYKVLPLTASSGLIEFVPNTMPLHEFLMPAHERYYPRDMKGGQCRKEIFNVQSRSVDTRISTYRSVTDRFHPVMKYFFMEYFINNLPENSTIVFKWSLKEAYNKLNYMLNSKM
ncbi:hypothetical protein O181_126503 [Austropuccinia psidii MF-1]|uniref:Serine/threonine-protein kinase TEL1 n=1 Tax=Austropuccinia psidii MF-1 TaxID=1389203 RepID=A0A9Q3Q620_9BASI|nr:hypothetical protein [Austropuccinia psidii MF-1]